MMNGCRCQTRVGIFDEEDNDRNPNVLARFARETGGEAFFPESSREIPAICEEIARDIRAQYTLTYVPVINSRYLNYRTISVKASTQGRGRLSVRTRTGYSVPVSGPAAELKAHP